MSRNRMGMTRLNVLVLLGVGVFGVLMLVTCADITAYAAERRATSRPTSRRSSGSVGGLLGGLFRSRESARRATCAMNLSTLGKGISLYQAGYREKYPALVNHRTLGQGAINETPEMVKIADSTDESEAAFVDGNVKGNGSVNAYYLLVLKGYLEEESFQCPSDKSFKSPKKRGYDLGFDGWKNLSYALQPTSINTADFSSRVGNGRRGNGSKGSMVIASDQVVDKKGKLTKTDNRPKENNAVNHGYGYVNALIVSNSVKKLTRKKGADSIVSKWGYNQDEIYALGMKGKAYPVTDAVSRRNDSFLMGKEGGK